MTPFNLHRPAEVGEACALLAELGDGATVYCGGTELLQVMKMGLASFDDLIDLKRIDELRAIDVTEDGTLNIGATVTHREIERSPAIARQLPVLSEMEKHVANVRVRNAGSLAGNLCFAEPHSDPATLLVAAGAVISLRRHEGSRDVAMRDFITGPLETVRAADEIVVSISIPPVPANAFMAYRKIAFKERPAASVAARVTVQDGVIDGASVVVGSVGGRPEEIDAAGASLVGIAPSEGAAAIEQAAVLSALSCEAAGDVDASEEYQRHLVRVLARRALTAAVRDAAESLA